MDNAQKDSDATIIKTIQDRFGKSILTDEELLLLAAESIRRSYTFEEKGYNPK